MQLVDDQAVVGDHVVPVLLAVEPDVAVRLARIVAVDRDLAVEFRPAGCVLDAEIAVPAPVDALDLARLRGGVGVVDRGDYLAGSKAVDDLDAPERGGRHRRPPRAQGPFRLPCSGP